MVGNQKYRYYEPLEEVEEDPEEEPSEVLEEQFEDPPCDYEQEEPSKEVLEEQFEDPPCDYEQEEPSEEVLEEQFEDPPCDYEQEEPSEEVLEEQSEDPPCVSGQEECSGSPGKRICSSRWEKREDDQTSKRRKTESIGDDSQLLQLPDSTKEVVVGLDSEIQELQAELLEINRKLQRSELLHDERPVEERSPSPEPVFDDLGIRINTRQARLRLKLVKRRQHIISKLIQKNPTSKLPLEYMSKLSKKLYIPVKQYPHYNFVGLIIGPRGNTQKRMEMQTGAIICVKGKDITKKPDDDDLHVYIEADNQKSLDAAVGMVEKLLNQIDKGMIEHKRTQLEELATLKGKYICTVCHEHDHLHYACPQLPCFFKMVDCDKCGSYRHSTETCQVIAMTPQICNSQQGSGSSLGSTTRTQEIPNNKEIDVTNLYVGYLPEIVDENRLIELFSLFGKITKARILRDRNSGISRGFGFVKFENQTDAAAAMALLNGYRMDGHKLAVRIAGVLPGTLLMRQFSTYEGPPPV